MTREEAEAHWRELLEANNPQPEEPVPMTQYRCLRCGGTFSRKISTKPPKQCPVCQCLGWNDPARRFRVKVPKR